MTTVLALTFGRAAVDVGHSLEEAFFMFWETLWALVLGFGLSGVVQAFASRSQIVARLGDHRPAAVARASVYGMVSSSCSYAASAMAKSLFQKGADLVSAMVFMFASTNLVVELGIVLVVLIGWQFAAAEFVGGVVMIVLLVAVGSVWLRGRLVEQARQRLASEAASDRHGFAAHSDADDLVAEADQRGRARTLAGWADAAAYTVADLRMLRREMLVGYGVAGFLCVLVPGQLWNDVFLRGHGFGTVLENVVVGPFIAVISFVCSIGNVPLAAALWKGGISFGGVVSFIFADLIAAPLLLIYRRYYGGRLALRLLGTFWLVMSAAGLVTEGIFRATGLVPVHRPVLIAPERFSWDYTTFLDIAFLAVAAGLYWLYRSRDRVRTSARYAVDPVCGMQVEMAHAPATAASGGGRYYFCSDRCAQSFAPRPQGQAAPLSGGPGGARSG